MAASGTLAGVSCFLLICCFHAGLTYERDNRPTERPGTNRPPPRTRPEKPSCRPFRCNDATSGGRKKCQLKGIRRNEIRGKRLSPQCSHHDDTQTNNNEWDDQNYYVDWYIERNRTLMIKVKGHCQVKFTLCEGKRCRDVECSSVKKTSALCGFHSGPDYHLKVVYKSAQCVKDNPDESDETKDDDGDKKDDDYDKKDDESGEDESKDDDDKTTDPEDERKREENQRKREEDERKREEDESKREEDERNDDENKGDKNFIISYDEKTLELVVTVWDHCDVTLKICKGEDWNPKLESKNGDMDGRSPDGESEFSRTDNDEMDERQRKRHLGLMVGIPVAVAVIVALVILGYCTYRRRMALRMKADGLTSSAHANSTYESDISKVYKGGLENPIYQEIMDPTYKDPKGLGTGLPQGNSLTEFSDLKGADYIKLP